MAAGGKGRRIIAWIRRGWRAVESLLTIYGLIGIGAGVWSGLDPLARTFLTATGMVALMIGGSSLLYLATTSYQARRAPPPTPPPQAARDPRAEALARLAEDLKVNARLFQQLATDDSTDFGLLRLINSHGGGELPGLYAQALSTSRPTYNDIERFVYTPGHEQDLIGIVSHFEAAVGSVGTFLDRFIAFLTAEARRNAAKGSTPAIDSGIRARTQVCVEDFNHFARHLRLWQDQLSWILAGHYSAQRVSLRAPPAQ